jgi:hypothetical protein
MPQREFLLHIAEIGPLVAIARAGCMSCQYFLAAPILLAVASAQEPSPGPLAPEQSQVSPGSSCLEPPPVVRFEDYNGPFAKFAGAFARKLERKAVELPKYRPGIMLCSLEPRAKFLLFVHDSFDPISVLASSFNAGLNQASNQDPSFGHGGLGYARRYGADYASATSARFFGDFLYPTIFSEDPRYYRLGEGSKKSRLFHAMRHVVITHGDNGTQRFNFTEWLSTASALELNNLYHPGNERGFGPAARRGAFSILQDVGLDVVREFWPEIAHTLRLPFRGDHDESFRGPR